MINHLLQEQYKTKYGNRAHAIWDKRDIGNFTVVGHGYNEKGEYWLIEKWQWELTQDIIKTAKK